MDAPRIRSRILVVALLLFITGSALAWNHNYRLATAPAADAPEPDRFLVIAHGGRLVTPEVPRERVVTPPPAPRTEPPPTPTPGPRPGPQPGPRASSRPVEVQAGDTLSDIAERELGRTARWKEIATLNAIPAPYRIFSGQTILVPKN